MIFFRSARPLRGATLAMLAAVLMSACSSDPPNPNPRAEAALALAPSVDLQKFSGRWYVIANIPYSLENGNVGSYVQYTLRGDGRIDDEYFARAKSFDAPLERKGHFVDHPREGTNNADWRVKLVWPIYFSMPILYVDPDYRYALIGYPGKSLGWVYARTPDIDAVTYHKLLDRFDAEGYDTTRFQRIAQTPAQLGLPGFQSPEN